LAGRKVKERSGRRFHPKGAFQLIHLLAVGLVPAGNNYDVGVVAGSTTTAFAALGNDAGTALESASGNDPVTEAGNAERSDFLPQYKE